MRSLALVGLLVAVLGGVGPRGARGQEGAGPAGARTIWLVGDSTVQNGNGTGADRLWGWGKFVGEGLDPARWRAVNRARGGRSSRTYRAEGLWDRVLAEVRPGDLVLIQFGHNDGGPLDSGRARASLKGVGAETRAVRREDGTEEVVHTFGWYLREAAREARAKGATPVLLSPIPRNIWKGGKVARADRDYGAWAAEVARGEGVPFLDLNARVADRYDALGPEAVGRDFFLPTDHTHTIEAGARLNAECVRAGLRDLGLLGDRGPTPADPATPQQP